MNNTRTGLADRIVIVTGASSGAGYAVARRLALQEGAIVIAVARRRLFRIEALARQITEQFGSERLVPITADMSAPGQAPALAHQVQERFGRIDGFLHAVNRALRLTALEVSDHEFDMTMQVNVKSALYGVQAITPALRRQGRGGIVIYNPTPVETPTFAASEAVYAAAAHALSALAAGWQRQLSPYGVQVREVAPAPTGDAAPGGIIPQEDLLVEALRETITSAPATTVPMREPARSEALLRPIILSQRGGLALTQFSQA